MFSAYSASSLLVVFEECHSSDRQLRNKLHKIPPSNYNYLIIVDIYKAYYSVPLSKLWPVMLQNSVSAIWKLCVGAVKGDSKVS